MIPATDPLPLHLPPPPGILASPELVRADLAHPLAGRLLDHVLPTGRAFGTPGPLPCIAKPGGRRRRRGGLRLGADRGCHATESQGRLALRLDHHLADVLREPGRDASGCSEFRAVVPSGHAPLAGVVVHHRHVIVDADEATPGIEVQQRAL
eukprot:565340-Alexandrium_andersonii.AAC.1